MKLSKDILIAGGVGVLIGWFGSRQLQHIAYELHVPRPDWEKEWDHGYASRGGGGGHSGGGHEVSHGGGGHEVGHERVGERIIPEHERIVGVGPEVVVGGVGGCVCVGGVYTGVGCPYLGLRCVGHIHKTPRLTIA